VTQILQKRNRTDCRLDLTLCAVTIVQLATTISNVTLKLSQVAVFIHLLRLEERHHEPRTFEDELESIEDHAEHGLYVILCRLHVIHRQTSALDDVTTDSRVTLAASIDAALTEVQLMDATRPAHRHLRTLSIISDFMQLLQRIIVVLDYVMQFS